MSNTIMANNSSLLLLQYCVSLYVKTKNMLCVQINGFILWLRYMCILEVVLAIIEQYNLLVRSVNRAKATYRQLYILFITFDLHFVCIRRRLTKIHQLKLLRILLVIKNTLISEQYHAIKTNSPI